MPQDAPTAPVKGAPPDANLGRLARASTASLLGAAAMALSIMLVTLLVTHSLSRDAAGIFFSTTSLFVLATSIGQLGTNTGVVYFLVRERAAGRPERTHAYMRAALRPVVITGIVMGIGIFIFAVPLSHLVNPQNAQESADYLRVLAFFVPIAGLENVTLAGTRGFGSMRPNVLVEQLGRPALQLVLVAAALSVSSHTVLALGWAFCYLPAAIAAAIWWRRISRRVPKAGARDGVGREFWRFTGPRSFASVAQQVMQRFDIVLVAALAGAVAAAVYTAATRFLVIGQMANRAVSIAVQPRLGQTLTTGDTHGAKWYYQISTAWLMLVTWPLYLMFVVYGEQLLAVFGKHYRAGSDVLLVLAFAMLLGTACGMVDMVLNMGGRTSWNLYNVLLCVGIQFTLCVILIPHIGIMGAAIGWAVAIAVGNLVPLVQVAAVIKVHPFGPSTIAAALVTVLCFGLVPFGFRMLLGRSWLSIAVAAVVGGLLYLILLWRLKDVLALGALRDLRRRRKDALAS